MDNLHFSFIRINVWLRKITSKEISYSTYYGHTRTSIGWFIFLKIASSSESGKPPEMTESISCLHRCLHSLDMLLNVKRHIGNYSWLAKVCLTTLIWIDQIKYTYLWIPNHMQNINSIPWLILEIKLAYSFESLLACQVCLTTTTWNDWRNL